MTSRISIILLGKLLLHTASKAIVELLSCSTYMNNSNCLKTQNFPIETELPAQDHSYANYHRQHSGQEKPNQAIIGVFDIETEPGHTSDFGRRVYFLACVVSVWEKCAEGL